MTKLRKLLQATIGRRLLVSIWVHGFFLFVGIASTLLVARYVLPNGGAALRGWPHVVLLLLVAIGLALVCVALPISRSIVGPLARLARLSRALGAGDLAVRADIDRRDEIGDLATAFNEMAERVQRLRHAERELLADVSHELRTPLARMRVVLDLASDADPNRIRRYMREIATDLAELEQLLADIIESSRLEVDALEWREARPPLRRQAVSVDGLVEASARRFRERWPHRRLFCQVAAGLPLVEGDPTVLRRALDNLLDNACKYSPDEKPIALVARPGELRDAAGVCIEVVDEGIGIAAEDKPRIFTSFFRADRSRTRATGGVGLGLALARRIIEAHGGTIGVESEPDRGSRFWFVLPQAAPPGE